MATQAAAAAPSVFNTTADMLAYCAASSSLPADAAPQYSIKVDVNIPGMYLDGKLWSYPTPMFELCIAPLAMPLSDAQIAQIEAAVRIACRENTDFYGAYVHHCDVLVQIVPTATPWLTTVEFDVSMNADEAITYTRRATQYADYYLHLGAATGHYEMSIEHLLANPPIVDAPVAAITQGA